MYLKELEIKGFKSFSNKIKLNITPGITVIVGPNGSGKSNITDAIRWILGEQNIRSLRGNKVTDMIYAGNDSGRASNIAEVAMLFDNEDQKLSIHSEEVQIKRIIYRSGEIENYVNNVPCRLKDIHELFWGTGLGRGSYSIIAQGKVDFVLNSKPTERRVLFEEASNISSYNNKKEIAIKKLEQVDNNLIRINDILSEVKDSLNHYQKKVDDLKLYQSYSNDIRRLEFFILSQQYLLYQKNIKNCNHHINLFHGEIEKIDRMIVSEKKNVVQHEKDLEKLEELLNKNEEKLIESEKEKNNTNDLLMILRQKKIEIEGRLKSLSEDKQSAENKLNSFKENLTEIEKDFKETSNSTSKINVEVNQKEHDYSRLHEISIRYKQWINKLESAKESQLPKFIYQVQEKKIKDEMILSNLKSSLLTISKEKENTSNKLQKSIQKLHDVQQNVLKLEKVMKDFRDGQNEIEKKLAKNEFIIEQLTNFLKDKHNDQILRNKEKEFLEEFRKNNRVKEMLLSKELSEIKYGEGMKWLGNAIGIIEYIPEKIDRMIRFLLNDKTFLLQIKNIENIISFQQTLGKNNLIQIKMVADNLISKQNPNKLELEMIRKEKNFIGFANELIKFPIEYHYLFEVLLGDIIIVEDLETALKLSNRLKEPWTIVSLDGTAIDHHGIITLNAFSGDHFLNDETLLSERIKQLEIELNLNENEIYQNQDNLNKHKIEKQELLKEFNEIISKIKNNNEKLYQESSLSKEMNEKISETKIFLKQLLEDENIKKIKTEELQKNMLISQKIMMEIEGYRKSFQLLLEIILRIKNICDREKSKISREIENLKMKLIWSRERESLLQKRKNEIEHFLQNYLDDKKNRQERLDSSNQEKSELMQQERLLENKLKLAIEKRKNIDSERMNCKEEIKNKEGFIRKNRENIEDFQRQLEGKINSSHQQEILHVQIKEKIDNLKMIIQNQYNSSIDEVLAHQKESGSNREATDKIDEYKSKISLMGQINFDALQEYEKQSVRYQDLQLKRDEILKSKEKLIHLVHEIDRVAENHFYQTFLKVEIFFKEIYQKLFHGGQASLELLDRKNLLETGIEVMVQPPGKNLQNLSLLSTGEKALTAIALLFALWKANPSPFCFFDEIDSALDEANVLRLASFLKNEDFKNTQIIIITHQKGIMEAADALYGVTMEGSGISKLMSVRMVDSEVQTN
ncbi:MAG: chromosome segregation protein SMC [Candidatus Atribacteria bacterium]|nr:chromosome segregation protein SMC [Candidatus Atribacteria bacterium]